MRMRAIYAQMHEARSRELSRIRADYEDKWKAAWATKSLLSKIFGVTPYLKEEAIDDTRFPRVPYYAVNLIGTRWAKAQV